jgi:hypothetical protein
MMNNAINNRDLRPCSLKMKAHKYRFPSIVTWLIHNRAQQRVNFPRKRFKAIYMLSRTQRAHNNDRR